MTTSVQEMVRSKELRDAELRNDEWSCSGDPLSFHAFYLIPLLDYIDELENRESELELLLGVERMTR